MKIIVQKFGGSSVADVQKLESVAECVASRRADGYAMVVVVSAMGKTTDALFEQALEIDNEPPQRELDMLVTAGERISMTLLTMAIQKLGIEAISFTGSQSGIITENRHQGARILEIRPHRIVEALEAGKVVIVAGYQGVSKEREVTTLGRGGSDTSAVAMAAALGAEVCEIYSDVDGVYSADPRVCEQARHLSELTYTEMQTMADAGAKVLNAQAVDFARRASIEIHAKQAHRSSTAMTKIRHEAVKTPTGDVRAVVGAKGLQIRLPVASMSRVFQTMEQSGAQLHYGQSDAHDIVSLWLTAGMSGVADGMLPAEIESLELEYQPVSIVTAVVSAPSVVEIERGTIALIAAGLTADECAFTGSAWIWVVPESQGDLAVRVLHNLWCET